MCDKMELLTLSPKDNSLFVPNSTSSSGTSMSDITSNDPEARLSALNSFLSLSGVKQSKKKFSSLQHRSQVVHITKASESVVALLEVIAPGDAGALWKATKKSKIVEKMLSIEKIDESDKVYLQALAETYKHAIGWDTKRQVLSIMADLAPLSILQKFLPGITRYRVNIAKRHKDLYGRGAPLSDKLSPRMCVSLDQLDHFLTFITSPHVVQDLPFGERNLVLSSGEVVKTPNVIRMMIKQRTITQYLQYCKENNFTPFSSSTMYRILTSCSASVRKSLQGLDYISAEGGTAFDDLVRIADQLIDHGLDPRIGAIYQKSLKEGKQYLKTDFKVIDLSLS